MTERIGIYPGTFDPVHEGHIAFAQEVLDHCKLTKIVFIPEMSPREKIVITSFHERLTLLQQTLKQTVNLEVAHVQSSPFTVKHTLPELRDLFPDSELTLLIGSDVVHTFSHRWEGLEELFSTMPLAIGMRTGDNNSTIQSILSQYEHELGINISSALIHTPHAHISSSAIRTKTH
jgi:nicotinate-nucleotide adenylyltransferase